jgi:hypothetical protein
MRFLFTPDGINEKKENNPKKTGKTLFLRPKIYGHFFPAEKAPALLRIRKKINKNFERVLT